MKVGIFCESIITWGGGIDMVKGYMRAMSYLKDVEMVLLIPTRDKGIKNLIRYEINDFKQILRSILYKGKSLNTHPKRVVKYFLDEFPGVDIVPFQRNRSDLVDVCKKHKVDILFPCCRTLPKDFQIPWIGYLFDCQHKHLPQNFDEKTIQDRDNAFEEMLRSCSSLFAISQAVVDDIKQFYNPPHSIRYYVSPYTPIPRDHWLIENPKVIAKYNLPERYFAICNQLWKHKDHKTAFKALSILRDKYNCRNISLVCTGGLRDGRWPDYYEEIKEYIKSLGIEKEVFLLGYIPKADQIEIIRHSIAVVQPTLFEGTPGGTCSLDTLSIGKSIILSDIRVNNEVIGNGVKYFRAGDPYSLAEKMFQTSKEEIENVSTKELEESGLMYSRQQANFLFQMFQNEINQRRQVYD